MTKVRKFSDSSNNESIRKAIQLGWWMVIFPSMFGMFSFWSLFFILVKYDFLPEIYRESLHWLLIFGLGGFVLSWLIWSIQVPKWRLKAYTMVDDIIALKQEAVAQQIIWPDGSLFEKTEIASKELKEKIAKLEQEKTKPTELREKGGFFKDIKYQIIIVIISVCSFALMRACHKKPEKLLLIASKLEEQN